LVFELPAYNALSGPYCNGYKKILKTAGAEKVQVSLLPKGTAVLLELPLWFSDLLLLL